LKSSAVEIPAVGNRVYTNDVRLRGRRGYLEIENHRVKSSTREGGFCLCRRGFNRRGFCGWAIGFFVDGGDPILVDGGDPIFCEWGRSDFLVDGRSGFLWMGRSNLREMCDRLLLLSRAIGFFCGWAIGFLG
jgi:hypothetical protein